MASEMPRRHTLSTARTYSSDTIDRSSHRLRGGREERRTRDAHRWKGLAEVWCAMCTLTCIGTTGELVARLRLHVASLRQRAPNVLNQGV